MKATRFSDLPSISSLLEDPSLATLPHDLVVRAAREVVDSARASIRLGQPVSEDWVGAVAHRVARLQQRRLRPVINATGIVIHTNLGRSPMSERAARAASEVARGYSNLEMLLKDGVRGGRLEGVETLLRELTGAEAAICVNNNAAAVLLALSALAEGREVLVSRGELVEIGGSFRVPDVISAGGAELVEVGTTNRTRVGDYARAITDATGVVLRVHPSNFKVVGFSARPNRAELVELAHQRGLLFVEDLGSGLLGTRLQLAGVATRDGGEETVREVVEHGADIVCFSGDKLMGGPQAGLIVGKRSLVERMRKHPLYRALRNDKMVLAALEATLSHYREGQTEQVPVRRMLEMPRSQCKQAAERIAKALSDLPVRVEVSPDVGYAGGGALPDEALPTVVVNIAVPDPDALAKALRAGEPPIVARVARERLILDPRTLLPGDETVLTAAICDLVAAGQKHG